MDILEILKKRYYENKHFHQTDDWDKIVEKINNDKVLRAVQFMEDTGGMPAVFSINHRLCIIDSITEQPKERVSLCYDEEALKARKNFPPVGSAIGMISGHDLRLINEEEYFIMQSLGAFDLKGSCWLETPSEFRKLGGALFGTNKYNRTFIFHNGADSYYNNRGFRTIIYL